MSSKIKAAIRIRPFLKSEVNNGYSNSCIQVNPHRKEVQVYDGHQQKNFNFDYILDQQASQEDVYQQCAIDHMIEKSLQGYHSTIFAYGQTGSGKTHTMHGEEVEATEGIIPKIFTRLFHQIANNKQRTFCVFLSFLQIYNQKIYDLLNPAGLMERGGAGLRLRWNKDEQFSVQNLYIFECANEQDLKKYFSIGLKNRISASHKLNVQSSRSHSILTIRIESFDRNNPNTILTSKLELVDLAGSERIGLTGAQGTQAKESIDINKSLFTLRQVITILADSSRSKGQKDKSYVPYRDSKLTSILKQSIGGNSYCLMIACICPNDFFIEENISTLTYATKASYITNQPTVNDDPRNKAINELRKQVKSLTEQLSRANYHIEMLSGIQGQHDLQDVGERKGSTASPLRRGLSERQTGSPIVANEQFSERLVQSINMVRQLLKSNKELREKLELSNQRNDEKDIEIFELTRENQHLKQQLNISSQKQSPTHSQTAIRTSTALAKKRHSSQAQRSHLQHHSTQQPLSRQQHLVGNGGAMGFSGGGSRNNFNYWNSVEINQYYMNQRGVDSVPTNFSRKEVVSSQEGRQTSNRRGVSERSGGRQALTSKLNSRNWKNMCEAPGKFLSFYQQSELY